LHLTNVLNLCFWF